MTVMHVVVWVVEGTWQGCIDAAAQNLPGDARFTLLHVTSADAGEAAGAAALGLFGRGLRARTPDRRFDDIAGDEASKLLAAAADRLGRAECERLSLVGRAEDEVIGAVAEGVDILVLARDGDRSRLGPRSLDHATRFVVDHAPCAVMLVWPDEAPGIESIPPRKHGPPPPHPPHHGPRG